MNITKQLKLDFKDGMYIHIQKNLASSIPFRILEDKKMKITKKPIHLTCLGMILIITGCASIKVIDTFPSGTPKGYIEFYYIKSETEIPPSGTRIYGIVNNQEIYEGRTSFGDLTKGKIGLRLAKRPGTYTFLIHSFEGKTPVPISVPVQIEEGMITPVKIIIPDFEKTKKGYTTTYTFNMHLFPGKAVPIAEYEKMRNYNSQTW
jgi:hypothetical protein